jgi:L,D-transpeptidase catalytic domain
MRPFRFYTTFGATLFLAFASVPVHAATPSEACALASADVDTDGDGLSDHYESCLSFTDPLNTDTDADGFSDKVELDTDYSPRFAGKRLIEVDSDDDYLNDDWELKLGTGLMNPDSDGDLYLDGTEVAASFDPLSTEHRLLEKLIRISDKDLRLTYSMGGITLGSLPVSTGKRATPTPHGTFEVQSKIPVKRYLGPTWDYPNTKYNLLFTRKNGYGYYIHSAYWHNKFGVSPVSGGCVNVRLSDMEPLYWWAQQGTTIVIEG